MYRRKPSSLGGRPMRAKILVKAIPALLGVVLLLAACSGGGSKSNGQSGSAAQQSGPVKLTFWTWATNINKVVAIWNQKNPNIQVTVSTPADRKSTRMNSSHRTIS